MFVLIGADTSETRACLLVTEERAAFLICDPHSSLTCLTPMHMHKIGGELLGLRRQETKASKSGKKRLQSTKEARNAKSLEAWAESAWNKRVLTVFEFLAQYQHVSYSC